LCSIHQLAATGDTELLSAVYNCLIYQTS
jgi:hypothetical protein